MDDSSHSLSREINPPTLPVTRTGHLLGRLERLPFTRMHLRVASLLGAGTLMDAVDGQIVAVALTTILSSLGAPMSAAGPLIAAGFAGQMVGAIGFGMMSERLGRKTVYIISSAIFGSLSLAAAFAWNVESLAVIRFVQGIGLGAAVPVAAAMFNEFVSGRSRGRVVIIYESLFNWGILLASVLGFVFLAVFQAGVAWRYLLMIGALPVATAVWAAFRLPESPRYLLEHGRLDAAEAVVREMEVSASRDIVAETSPSSTQVVVERAHIRRPTHLGELFSPAYRGRTAHIACIWLANYFALWGFTSFMPTLLAQAGFSRSLASLLSGAFNVLGLVMLYIVAATLDRWGRRFWFLAGHTLSVCGATLGAIVFVFLGSTNLPVLLLAGAAVMVGANVNGNIAFVYTAELFPTRMRAWATMAGSSLRCLAAVIAPIVFGFFIARGGIGVGIAFALSGLLLLTALVVVARFGIETRQRSLEELAS
ncbi:MAG: transporter, putative metabolite:H+ symporter [Pseudonocardiales bacterium]|nr:transporter, putative metabolite:H+ symporter [Pseudonocardiales bacterium]